MRAELGEYIRRITTVPLPAAPNVPIIDYEVQSSELAKLILVLRESSSCILAFRKSQNNYYCL